VFRIRPSGLAALLLAACGTAGPVADPWPSRPPQGETVGHLGEEPITYAEVARHIRQRDPQVFYRNLEALILERVTRADAEPLGVTVASVAVTRETEIRMRKWEKSVQAAARAQTGQDIDLALWLRVVADMSMAEFRDQVRDGAEVELLQNRLLRYESLTAGRIEVSLIVVADKKRADELVSRLRAGALFRVIAAKHSVHPTRKAGGRIPYPLLRDDINDSPVRDAMFEAGAGDIVGPFVIEGGARKVYHIYRIEKVSPGRKGVYAQLEQEVVRSLEARPVPVAEYERWRRRILLRHGYHAAYTPGESG